MNQEFVKHILVDDGSHLSKTWVYGFDISRVKEVGVFHNS